MDEVARAVAAISMMLPAPVHARATTDPVTRWAPYIGEASVRFGVPADWIVRVIRAESGGRTTVDGRPIRSRAGAIGLMQLMPATWTAMRDANRLGADPDDPRDNILAGTAYLRLMADRFGYPGLFAAYNAGPARYATFLAGRSRLPSETIAYIGGVTGHPAAIATTVATRPTALLFALRRDLGATPEAPRPVAGVDGMFAIRKAIP